jgi:hypothetical protein
MIRNLSVVVLMMFIGAIFVTNAVAFDGDVYVSHKKLRNSTPVGPVLNSGDVNESPMTVNMISEEVGNFRVLLGGGQKLIRHDCAGEDPMSLEAVFTRDINRPEMRLHDALSTDNGATWTIAGPLTPADADTGRDRNHVIDFADGLTYLTFTEMTGHPVSNGALMFWTGDLFQCLQSFNPFTQITNSPLPDSMVDEYYTQVVMEGSGVAYMSFIGFLTGDPYDLWFRSSTDNGTNWGDYLDINATIGTDGFDMQGTDGPLMMDADGDFIAALVYVFLDTLWGDANGFERTGYPAYTQSLDAGATWADLRLLHGNDATMYPNGHTGDPVFDANLRYDGGLLGAGLCAFNCSQDNCVITPDGVVHLTYYMNSVIIDADTAASYVGVFHTIVDNGTITNAYVGFPEDPDFVAESGVADYPSVATSADGHVVVGWTEYVYPDGTGDICYNVIPAGQAEGVGAVNATQSVDDETFQRIVDITVPTGNPDEFYIDWLFLYYDPATAFALDSTIYHFQTTYTYTVGIGGDDPKGPGIPKAVALSQNYPNPFNPMTSITFSLNEDSKVVLEIMNLRGQLIETLEDGVKEAGNYTITWDGRNARGELVSSGIYFYRLRTDNGFNQTRKMVLLK